MSSAITPRLRRKACRLFLEGWSVWRIRSWLRRVHMVALSRSAVEAVLRAGMEIRP